jgi:hypothetical protein
MSKIKLVLSSSCLLFNSFPFLLRSRTCLCLTLYSDSISKGKVEISSRFNCYSLPRGASLQYIYSSFPGFGFSRFRRTREQVAIAECSMKVWKYLKMQNIIEVHVHCLRASMKSPKNRFYVCIMYRYVMHLAVYTHTYNQTNQVFEFQSLLYMQDEIFPSLFNSVLTLCPN